MSSKQITFQGREFASARKAIKHAAASGGDAIAIAGRFFAAHREEASRLDADGVAFAYLYVADHREHEYGVLITVPVN
ncbi:MAG: hypothetical protein KJZ54_14065 [Phycisphaerales bacterium]|nr:hypothetical protein [Phycisphaerales bacterium]